jgi:outer membrane protein
MTMNKSFLIAFVCATLSVGAQEVLPVREAARMALANNYDVLMARFVSEIAENNADIRNSGMLPTLTTTAGGNVNFLAGENQLIIGDQVFDARTSFDYNAALGMQYVLLDNNGRKYNYQSLKEQHNLSELQARQIIENTLLNLCGAYFDIALLTENIEALKATLSASKLRLKRAEAAMEAGVGIRIEVLNAKVDMSSDSVAVLDAVRELENAKRTFNLILGRDLNAVFIVDTTIAFGLSDAEEALLSKAMARNVLIEQAGSSLRNSEFAIKAGQSGWFPALAANASYTFRGSRDPNGPFVTGSYAYGPRAGLTLSWNLFDGGRTSVRVQNAKIEAESRKLEESRVSETVKRDLLNAHDSYRNALFVLEVRKDMVEAARQSLERSTEQLAVGRITSIEFRQAQINLLQARAGLSQAKYNAKNIELLVKQLSGMLLEEF